MVHLKRMSEYGYLGLNRLFGDKVDIRSLTVYPSYN